MTSPSEPASPEPAAPAPDAAPAGAEPAGADAEPAGAEPEDPDTLETLARDLRDPVLGYPRQRITALLILVLVGIALLIGFGALARQGLI